MAVLYGCATIFLVLLPAWFFGVVGTWIGDIFSPEAASYGKWIGRAIPAITGLFTLTGLALYGREEQALRNADERAGLIQEIQVSVSRVAQIEPAGDCEPNLVFDIGDGKLLLLQGQWLYDPKTYGASKPDGDPIEEFVNGLDPPYSFPSTDFDVVRFPHCGNVPSIKVRGEYLPPEETSDEIPREHVLLDSEILTGSFEAITDALQAKRDPPQDAGA